MELHLMRHGIAAEHGPWKSDHDRPLTAEGVEQTRRAARGLVAAGIGFERVFSSPLVRALQTARIMAEAPSSPQRRSIDPSRPGQGVEVEVIDALGSGLVQDELFSALRRARAAGRILLVGHEPDMGLLAVRLLGLPPSQGIPFRKGALARIDVDALPPVARGALVWMLTPDLAASLAG